jgi:hypothetical protein
MNLSDAEWKKLKARCHQLILIINSAKPLSGEAIEILIEYTESLRAEVACMRDDGR